jgi:hypothetical protein
MEKLVQFYIKNSKISYIFTIEKEDNTKGIFNEHQ